MENTPQKWVTSNKRWQKTQFCRKWSLRNPKINPYTFFPIPWVNMMQKKYEIKKPLSTGFRCILHTFETYPHAKVHILGFSKEVAKTAHFYDDVNHLESMHDFVNEKAQIERFIQENKIVRI